MLDPRAFADALGLPGLADLHTHFLPPRVMAKVRAQFDAAGLKTLLLSMTLAPALLWLAIRTFSATKGVTSRTVASDAGLVVGR